MITIAVCTYNRSEELPALFGDLRRELNGASDVEILVVDNACTDNTSSVVEEVGGGLPVRVVCEPRRGIAHARNCALAEARGDMIIFFDDDVRLDAGVLQAYRDAFARAEVLGGGGPIRATWPAEVPAWIGDRSNPPFPGVTVHYDLGASDRLISTDDPVPLSGNFAFRLAQARTIGFRVDLGHVGRDRTIGGEDIDFSRRFIQKYGRVTYIARAGVTHPVRPTHVRLANALRYVYRGGMAEAVYSPPAAGGRGIGRVPLWVIRDIGFGAARMVGGAVTIRPRTTVEGLGMCARRLGYMVGLFAPPRRTEISR